MRTACSPLRASSPDDVSGGDGDDSLRRPGADRVYGRDGNDKLHALAADGDVVTAEQDEGENADADAGADS